MENHAALAVTFALFALYAFFGRRLEASIFSGPLLFTALGLGFAMAGWAPFVAADRQLVEFLATATLVVVLFRDAANIRFSSVLAQRAIAFTALRLLFMGIPLIIAAGTLAAFAVLPGIGIYTALVLAILLTPTDAALAQPVFLNESLPEVPREAIDAESGLNDGLCLPLLIITLSFATEAPRGLGGHSLFFVEQIVLGPAIGLAVGILGALVTAYADRHDYSYPVGRTPVMVVLAGLAYFLSETVGGNGFLAAFMAGLAFGFRLPRDEVERASGFAKTEGSLLIDLTFLLFGAVILPRAVDASPWSALAYAVVSLTLVRMLPVFLVTIGSGQDIRSRLFMGWFGPRGLASVLYLVVVVDRSGFTGAQTVTDIAVYTILLSIVLHGVTAPFAAPIFFGGRAVTRQSAE